MTSKHIVLAPWGSLGDLHPFLAVALELQSRGHRVTIATSETYRAKIEGAGVGFHAVRPDLPQEDEIEAKTKQLMHARRGTEFLFRDLLMPALRDGYNDLSALATGCDLLVTHPAQMAGPLVAQKFGLRWASTVLAPISLYSAYDPPILPHRLFRIVSRLGIRATRLSFRLIPLATRAWFREVALLRRELGLPKGENPLTRGQYSPQLNLAMFSSALGAPQPDWPRATIQSGFAFYDTLGEIEVNRRGIPSTVVSGQQNGDLSPALQRFLEAGEAPLVFTLGSAAVHDPGDFYRQSAQAARLLGRRAILLGDLENCGDELQNSNAQIVSFDYAPYSQLFPRAAAIVHQGGVGTTAQAMRAGRPQLVVPHAHDQPDNASRIVRRGLGEMLGLGQYQAQRVAGAIRPLLERIEYSIRAREIGEQVQNENGAAHAADALEALLRNG